MQFYSTVTSSFIFEFISRNPHTFHGHLNVLLELILTSLFCYYAAALLCQHVIIMLTRGCKSAPAQYTNLAIIWLLLFGISTKSFKKTK